MGDVSFSVDLQEPISYSLYILITGLVIMAVGLFVFLMFWKRWIGIYNGRTKAPAVKKKPVVVLSYLRSKYLRQIGRLEKGLRENKADIRTAYQELSRIIRAFVHEATGLDVQVYTYYEIKALNIQYLTSLMETYYEPEFAPGQDSAQEPSNAPDAAALIRDIGRTKGVIQAWR